MFFCNGKILDEPDVQCRSGAGKPPMGLLGHEVYWNTIMLISSCVVRGRFAITLQLKRPDRCYRFHSLKTLMI